MAASANMTRDSRLPAMLAAVVLHGGVVAVGWFSFMANPPPVAVEVTPISLVSASEVANARAAVAAPVAQEAQAPTPEPPTPPKPELAKSAPEPPKLNLDQLSKTKPQKLDLDQLSKSGKSSSRSLDLASLADPHVNATQRGPARPETAEVARKAVGAANGLSADARSYLAGKLIKLWNPNCGVEDVANVVVRVHMRLSPEGLVLEARDLEGDDHGRTNPAAIRALTAVKQAQPYDGLPRSEYAAWRDVNFNFIAKDACRR
jgi:outer membrane biosynthesis protein TonB